MTEIARAKAKLRVEFPRRVRHARVDLDEIAAGILEPQLV